MIITGQKRAIQRQARRRLERLAAMGPDPSRIRRELVELNEAAAQSPATNDTVSAECSVMSLRSDGQGAGEFTGDKIVPLRQITGGVPMPTLAELEKMIGFKLGRVAAMTSVTSGPRKPFEPCRPQLRSGASHGYRLTEIRHPELSSLTARDANDAGGIVGQGTRDSAPGDPLPWIQAGGAAPRLGGFVGAAAALNGANCVAATARMTDGRDRSARWQGGGVEVLACFKGEDAGATALNEDGTVVGWVCIDPVDRGQGKFRPATWSPSGDLAVLEDFGCDWGQCVAATASHALIVGYRGSEPRALLWELGTDRAAEVGRSAGVFPMALTEDLVVLGKANTSTGQAVAGICRPGTAWEPLGTPPGWYATAINDAGDAVGATVVDGFERPWLRRSSGLVVWLPFYDFHWCRPAAITNTGLVVGSAQADHGTHALIWTRSAPSDT